MQRTDLELGGGTWAAAATDDETLWIVEFTGDNVSYRLPAITSLSVGGNSYTTLPTTRTALLQIAITGINNNQSFAFTITGDGICRSITRRSSLEVSCC